MSEPTATRYILARGPQDTLVLLHLGKRLVTSQPNDRDDGSSLQTFPSVAAASEHLERVLMLRGKDGYVMQATEQVSADTFALAVWDSTSPFRLQRTNGRVVVCFRDRPHNERAWSALFSDLANEAPRSLELRCDPGSPGRQWQKAIVEHQLPSITGFIFDAASQTQTRQGKNSIGDLTATLGALPQVERVFATGALELSAVRHEHLRELHLLGDPLSASMLKQLAGCEFPALERLVLSLASDTGPVNNRGALNAVLGLRAPRLRELHVDSLADVGAALDTLAGADLPALRVLGLSGRLDEEELLRCIGARVARLRELEVVALPLGNEVSSTGDEAARALVPGLRDAMEFESLTLPATYADW
jgi:hypothetical protein